MAVAAAVRPVGASGTTKSSAASVPVGSQLSVPRRKRAAVFFRASMSLSCGRFAFVPLLSAPTPVFRYSA